VISNRRRYFLPAPCRPISQRLGLVLGLLVVLAPGLAAAAEAPSQERLASPAEETRAHDLQREFRCLVCQGQSLDESEAPLAADLRHLIRERIRAGDSDAKIERYLVGRYGEFILMRPPIEPSTYALWAAPVILLLVALAIALTVIKRAEKRARGVQA
jgi:cytochrome c-type biogenesis protein CcmH